MAASGAVIRWSFSMRPSGDSEFIYTNVHDGSIEVGGAGTITYTGLEPIDFDSAGGTLTFTLTAASDDIAVAVSGGEIVLTGATIETTNVDLTGITAITINSGGGSDRVTINNALTQNVTLNVLEVVLNANIGGTVSGTASVVHVNSGAIIQDGIDVAGAIAPFLWLAERTLAMSPLQARRLRWCRSSVRRR